MYDLVYFARRYRFSLLKLEIYSAAEHTYTSLTIHVLFGDLIQYTYLIYRGEFYRSLLVPECKRFMTCYYADEQSSTQIKPLPTPGRQPSSPNGGQTSVPGVLVLAGYSSMDINLIARDGWRT